MKRAWIMLASAALSWASAGALAAQDSPPSLNIDGFLEFWQAAQATQTDLRKDQLALDSARIIQALPATRYPGNLQGSLSVTGPNTDRWPATMPDSTIMSLSATQTLAGQSRVGLEAYYQLDRIDYGSSVLASQLPKVGISLRQGLLPYWAQGETQAPADQLAANEVDQAWQQLGQDRRAVLVSLAASVVEYRSRSRQASLAQNQVDLLSGRLEAAKRALTTGAVNQTAVWDAEKALREAQARAEDHRAAAGEASLGLIQAAGVAWGQPCERELPAATAIMATLRETGEAICPKAAAGQRSIDLQEQRIHASLVQRAEAAAPVLELRGGLQLGLNTVAADKPSEAWAKDVKYKPWLTASLDLSPMLDQAWDRDWRLAQAQRDNLSATRQAALRDAAAERARVELRLENLEARIRSQAENLAWAVRLAEAAAGRLRDGSLNPLDAGQYRLDYLAAAAALADSRDQLWYWQLYFSLL
jgi:hypothetical protein